MLSHERETKLALFFTLCRGLACFGLHFLVAKLSVMTEFCAALLHFFTGCRGLKQSIVL
jgi:hypothetical protein